MFYVYTIIGVGNNYYQSGDSSSVTKSPFTLQTGILPPGYQKLTLELRKIKDMQIPYQWA